MKLNNSTHRVKSPLTGVQDVVNLSGEMKLEGTFSGFDKEVLSGGTAADTEVKFELEIEAKDTSKSPEIRLKIESADEKIETKLALDDLFIMMLDMADSKGKDTEKVKDDVQDMTKTEKVEAREEVKQETEKLLPEWAIPGPTMTRLEFETILQANETDWLTWMKNYAAAAMARRPDAKIFVDML